ncbi:MAG: hypothetical protein FWG21_02500 [Oscillospiraceae bacterium]|nr:hypothetical protein [Oscillospiraceae bacterium]
MITDIEFCGNHKLKQTVDEFTKTDSFPQSLLICAEQGLGRNLFARLAARDYLADINGLSLRHVHPDCIEVRGSGNSGAIPVDAIRAVTYEVNKASVMTDMKRVVIIEDAANLNQSSSAALLKTLEQPPNGVVFLITVSSPKDLLETIQSRCMLANIVAPSVQEATEYVTGVHGYEDKKAVLAYSKLFRGRIGYILTALESDDMKQQIAIAADIAKAYYIDDELMMCSALDRVQNRKDLSEILELFVFCLAENHKDDKTIRAINQTEKMKNMLSKNLSLKLFSTVFVKQLIGRQI